MGDDTSRPQAPPNAGVMESPLPAPPSVRPVFVPPRPSSNVNGGQRPSYPGSLRPPVPGSTPPTSDPLLELSARAERLQRELNNVQARFSEVASDRDRLRIELAGERAAVSSSGAAARTREAEQAATIQQLERRLAEREMRLAAQRELEARVDELEGQAIEVAALRARNAELEARAAAFANVAATLPEVPPAAASAKPGSKSTREAQGLRQIRGIGPAFERALAAAGVASVAQVAAWSSADIEHFAGLLRIKGERIRREDWVGRARALTASVRGR